MKNNLRQVLEGRGIERLQPTAAQLAKMGIKPHRWRRIMNGAEMRGTEIAKVADLVGCQPNELLVTK